MEPHAPADLSRTWAIVPIRGLDTAKTRLGAELDPAARRAVVGELLRRTLVAARDARRIEGTIVVTRDPAVAGMAREHRAIGLVEQAPGLNEAIDAARSLAAARGATAVLVLPADLPAVGPAPVDELLEAAGRVDALAGLVVLVPDRHRLGTNALLLSPPEVIATRFGEGSRGRHRGAAEVAGARFLEVDGPLSLDIDTAADLLAAEAALGSLHG